jgi:HD-like signal output (HDOD) protein/signal transduction histidine kinase
VASNPRDRVRRSADPVEAGAIIGSSASAPSEGLTRQLERVIERIDSLPTLSNVARRVLALSSAENADMREVAQIVESDPALTAKILAICKRADKGLSSQVVSVERAVVLLGFETVRAATLSVEVFELLSTRKTPEPHERNETPAFDRSEYWRFCVAVACASELLAAEVRRPGSPKPAEAFTCGLLHGVGLIALDMVIPRTLKRVVEFAERKRTSVADASRAVVGFDHHTAGRRLAERWDLPQTIVDVIWLHGLPVEGSVETQSKGVIALVDTAIAIARRLHIGWSADFSSPPDPAPVGGQIGLGPTAIERVLGKVHERVADRVRVLGLDETPCERLLLESIYRANAALDSTKQTALARSSGADALARSLQSIASLRAAPEGELRGIALDASVARSAAMALGAAEVVVAHFRIPDEATDARPEWTAARWCGAMSPPLTTIEGPALAPEDTLRALRSVRADALALHCDAASWAVNLLDDPGAAKVIPILGRRCAGMLVYTPGALGGADTSADETSRAAIDGLSAWWASLLDADVERSGYASLHDRLVEASRRLADAQKQLVENESLARLAEVAAGAAHEMNNPLTVIAGRAQQLAQSTRDSKDRAAAEAIDAAARKLSDLVTSLRLYADPPRPRPAPMAMRDALDRALRIATERAKRTSDRRPEVRVLVEHLPCMPVLDGVQVTEAVAELIANALEADGAGTIVIRAATEQPDGRLVISVIDDGPGLSEKGLRHACDPFYSEKKAGRQQGLGLARARRLVGLNGGDLVLRNRDEGGVLASLVFADAKAIFPGRGHQSAA